MTEGVAALAIPAGVGILKKIATSSALKYAGAGALTGAGYLASKKISDMSDDEIEKSGTIDPLDLGKNPQRKRDKLRNVVTKLGDEIKGGVKQVKKGLSVDPKDVTGKKYRTPEMKGKSPADYVRDLLKKQGREYKRRRIKNKKIDRDLNK